MLNVETSPRTLEIEKKSAKLTPEQVFHNPDGLGFTEFGRKVFGVIVKHHALMDPNPKNKLLGARYNEIMEEIDATCKELSLDPKQVPDLSLEMFGLISDREELIKQRFPLKP